MRFQGDAVAQDLYAAVLAAPDDDGPRLVLADHLISKGDPRGELIVIQCKRGEMGLAVETGDETAIIAKLPETALTKPCNEWIIRRGFLDEVSFEHHFMRETTVADVRGLLASPEAETVTNLVVRGFASGLELAQTIGDAMRGPLARLRHLTVSKCTVRDAGVEALLKKCPAPLEALALDNNAITGDGAETIAEHAPPTLRSLELSYSTIGAVGAEALARSPRLARLQSLSLIRSLTFVSVKALFAGHLPSLKKLDISWSQLGEWAGFLTHVKIGHLEDLDLCGNNIGDDGLIALVRGHAMGNLRRLCLGNNQITDAGIDYFCARANELPNLRTLLVENNPISDRSFDAIMKAFKLERLGIWGQHELSAEGFSRYRKAFP